MSELDFKKQLLINEFKTLSKGKNNDEILPLILALSRKAQQSGISFSKDDIYLIIDQVKDGLTPKEQQLLPQLLMLLEQRRYNKPETDRDFLPVLLPACFTFYLKDSITLLFTVCHPDLFCRLHHIDKACLCFGNSSRL